MPAAEPAQVTAPKNADDLFGSRKRKITVISGVVALLIVIAGVVVAIMTIGGGSNSSTQAVESDTKTIDAISAVSSSEGHLITVLQVQGLNKQSLGAIRNAGTSLSVKADNLRIVAAMMPASSDSTTTVTALNQLQSAEVALAQATSQLGASPSAVTSSQIAAIAAAATGVHQAWVQVQTTSPNLGKLAPSSSLTVAALHGAAHRHEARASVRNWVAKVNNILTQSANGRSDLASMFAKVSNCLMTPDQGAQLLNSVASNRDSVLQQLAALPAPTAKTQNLTTTLQSAIQSSAEADRHYADWVLAQTSWYYESPVGCPSGVLPSDGNKSAGDAASGLATGAKQQFVDAYNPLAQEFGFKTWTASNI
ncbi:MAG: hypothetical protein WCL12_06725 [Actinomycetes bacterium]